MGFERPKVLNRPCHLRTHGAVAESVADVAESEQENGPPVDITLCANYDKEISEK